MSNKNKGFCLLVFFLLCGIGINSLSRISSHVQTYKVNCVFEFDQALNQPISNPKGGHGLHKDSFKLQTMAALVKSFCGGSRGAGVRRTRPIRDGIVFEDVFHFSTCNCNLHLPPLAESAPLVAEGKNNFILDDQDRDGFPDVVELIDERDRMRFRRWFAAIAESQFYAIHSQWPKIRWDCTGLICFAYKEALKIHNHQWLKGFRYLTNPAIPDITVFHYPEVPLIKTNLFRTAAGAFKARDLENNIFHPVATAQVLMNYNCHYLGNQLDESILEGDLLFFRYFVDERMVYHTMILVKSFYGKSNEGPDGIVVYHTGPDGSDSGEVRKCSVSTLNRHPDDVWHVKPNNPHFLGFYRFNILDYRFFASGGQGE